MRIKILQGMALYCSLVVAGPMYSKDLVIGKQDADAKSGMKTFGPIAEALSKALGVNVTVKTFRFPSQMDAEIQSGGVDIMIDTPFNVQFVDSNDKLEGLVNVWKKGSESQQACLSTLPGKNANFKQLKGKKVLLEDPFSTGSYGLPMTVLLKHNAIADFQLITADDAKKAGGASSIDGYKNFKLDPNKIGVIFTGDDEKSGEYLKVDDQFALAGVSCKSAEELQLNVIEKSKAVPRNVFMVQKSMDAETKKKIVTLMLPWTKDTPELAPLKGTAVKELTADQKAIMKEFRKEFQVPAEWVKKNGLAK